MSMYDGVKMNGKMDPDFEFGWYMESIELNCEGVEQRARDILRGMFCGVLRMVMGYKWLEECPKGLDLTGLKVTAVAEQHEDGKNYNEVLGNWRIVFNFEACADSRERVTTRATLVSIQKTMERFIRNRFDVKEPTDLSLILLEKQRKDLIDGHFIGMVG